MNSRTHIGDLSFTWDSNKIKTSESITGVMSGYGLTSARTTYVNEDLCFSSSLPPPASSLLIDIDANGTADVNFQYDALGRRVARSGTGGSVDYVQMEQQTIADYPVGGAATTPTFRYVYASYIDEPVVRKTAGTGGTLVYFHRNHQYSVTAVTTSTGAIAEHYAYSAYGQPTILDPSGITLPTSNFSIRSSYTGREWDAMLGLHHFRARWMSPSAGRFLGKDPMGFEGSGSLLYDFLRGDTLEKLDPSGLIPITCECQCAYGKANQNSPDGSGRWLFYTTVNCNGLAATCCSNTCNNLNCRDVLIDYGRCGGKKVVRRCDNCVFTGHWRAPGHPFNYNKPCAWWNQSKSNCMTFCSEGFRTCSEIGIASCILSGRNFLNCSTAAAVACQIAYGSVCERICDQCLKP